ncbi:hypothetical protein ACJJTC_016086 [Scirpophaga incertulas]
MIRRWQANSDDSVKTVREGARSHVRQDDDDVRVRVSTASSDVHRVAQCKYCLHHAHQLLQNALLVPIHGHIHSNRKNRLSTERAAKISFISYKWNLIYKHEEDEDNFSLSPACSTTSSTLNVPSTSQNVINIEFLDVNTAIYESDSDSD